MEKEPITSQGLEKIKKELEELKTIKRPKIVAAIAEARAHGDLKENAEYHAAKEEQGKIEGRVMEINDLIARANVINVTILEKKDIVIFGSTVDLVDLDNNKEKTYKIVGKDEADLKKNLIYFRSPIGKALIGKNKNDVRDLLLFSLFINSKTEILDIEKLMDYLNTCKIPKFPISGDYLKKYGYKTGQSLGQKLKSLEEKWVENNFVMEEKWTRNL